MTLIAVPNVSEGRDGGFIRQAAGAVEKAGGKVLDVHSDARHNRTVLTVAPASVDAMVALASICTELDLVNHQGVHPRLGVLDVCPIVPLDEDITAAVSLARGTGQAIASSCDLPVYLYGDAALRESTIALPSLREGGLEQLAERMREVPPDFGPRHIDPHLGVVCVGARGPLIAFNIWIEVPVETARSIARRLRERSSGLRGVRALGLDMGAGRSQISMNLTEPAEAGIDAVFEAATGLLREEGVDPQATEIVGLTEERFAPDPQKEAARLLIQPGRTLESAMSES